MNTVITNNFLFKSIFKLFFISTLVFTFLSNDLTHAFENKILIKLNNEIITTVDISNEINYLKAFNKNVEALDNKKIIKIAKNSVIKERLKKIEILKFTENLTIDEKYLNSMMQDAYFKIGFDSIDQFKNHLIYHDVDIKKVEEKLILDAYWNQIIYNKYKNKIKIDKKKILNEISNRKNKFYNISEIMFNVEKNENINQKYSLIKNSIDQNGFENTALIYSESQSSANGGDLGWINVSAISPQIVTKLYSIKKGEITEAITIPGGFLILKVKDIKEEDAKIDVNKELEKIIRIKTNEQLNQFSNLYINKIRKNITVNEL